MITTQMYPERTNESASETGTATSQAHDFRLPMPISLQIQNRMKYLT
jgi:hypothetical protein